MSAAKKTIGLIESARTFFTTHSGAAGQDQIFAVKVCTELFDVACIKSRILPCHIHFPNQSSSGDRIFVSGGSTGNDGDDTKNRKEERSAHYSIYKQARCHFGRTHRTSNARHSMAN